MFLLKWVRCEKLWDTTPPPPKNSNFAKHYIDEDNKTIITTSVMRELIKLIASLSPLQEKETEVNMAPTCLTLYN